MKEIYLTQGKVALVDDEDYQSLIQYNWHYIKKLKENTGYASRSLWIEKDKCTTIMMHRIILNASEDFDIDHIDRNGINNQKYNLRLITTTIQNCSNSKSRKGTSKYKGVHWHKQMQMWAAQIVINQKKEHLGCYYSEEMAARVYDHFAREHYGEYARYNFPREGERSALAENQEEIIC